MIVSLPPTVIGPAPPNVSRKPAVLMFVGLALVRLSEVLTKAPIVAGPVSVMEPV